MIITMRKRSQITLPEEIVKDLGLSVGDKFEVTVRDGGVFLRPVVALVYPKAKLEEIAKIVKDHEKNPSAAFESVEDMFKSISMDFDIGIGAEDGDV